MKKCILYEGKICNDCGECMRCDLDPNKICDNCGKCLRRSDDRYRSLKPKERARYRIMRSMMNTANRRARSARREPFEGL